MKKIVLASLLLVSGLIYAENTQTIPLANGQAILLLGVQEVQNGMTKINIEKQVISRSSQQIVCWAATNVGLGKQNISERFTAPASMPMTLEAESGTLMSSNTGNTQHLMKFQAIPDASGYYTRCWQFTPQDPLGNYQIAVRIGETQFSPVSFRVEP